MNAPTESYTRLHGRWLFRARLAWLVIATLTTIMHLASLPVAFQLLRTPCYAEPCDTPFQTPSATQGPLQEQEDLKGAWQSSIWEVTVWLLTLAVGLLIFWRRSDDWMAHLASIMLVTILAPLSPWPQMLADRQPLWYWPRALLWAIGLASAVGLFYLFPDGRFVPRWTRGLVIAFLILTCVLAVAGAPFLAGFPVFMAALATGTVFQVYRYQRVSNASQRQQTKWVILGIIGMVIPLLVVLLAAFLNPSLNPLLHAGPRSLQDENFFSRMVTFGLVLPLGFLPVTLAFSVLRYRLWDVDILINRTLVYGALTTGVVSLYVLIVGWSSIGLQTQNKTAGSIFAILVIAFLFQPLRQQLQRIADRFMPVPRVDSRESFSPPKSQTQKGQKAAATDGSPDTTLRGRWLLFARLVWVIGFITLTALYALGFLAVHDALSTVCEEERCTLGRQIRYTAAGEQVMNWQGPTIGYADPLHPDQVEALKTLGLTLDQYGWLGALQMGIPALVFLLIAAGLFWRKSDNWMALFVSVMLATTPLWAMPLSFTLAVRQPAWTWVVGLAGVVATNTDQIFPLIFPTGRFVPRWTRWTLVLELVGSVLLWFYLPFADYAGQIELVIVFILIYSSIGIYAMVYRYVRVASPLERQQLKWIFGGDTGFLLTQLLILLPLNGLLASRAGSMDPAQALILSAILNTLFQATTFLRPVSIVIAVLRYRLWEIDVIISRTLVYGILSAGIVVTYILLVGLLGTLFNTNVSLAATLVTAALTISFFQPFRASLQSVVNRITFGGQNMTVMKQEIEETPTESGMSLSPRWLQVMHSVWFICALLTVIILIGTVPVYYGRYLHPSLSDPYSLGQFNVPFQSLLGLGACAANFISFGLAILLFWRKPNDRMALFLSFFFLITTVSSTYDYFLNPYVGAQTAPPNFISSITFPLWILLFCIFPDGRFVPRWTRWLFLVSILASFSYIVFPDWFFILQFTAGPQFFLATYAQVYRYRRISNDEERKQTKWAVFGWLVVMVLSLIASFIYKKPSGPLINVFPLFVAIAILHSRLWNIDLILNRALVYGALTAGIVALYILLVGTLSLLSQTTGNLLISLLATGLIAFLFQPLRERLQGSVNRLLYGDRDDPYAALSRLGRRLEASLTPEAVLPTIVNTVREALKLPYTAIYLKQEDNDHKIVAESAAPSLRVENGKIKVPGIEREGQCIPLIHQGETLGYLVLGPRTPNEAFTSSDLRLVNDLAPQVGVAVHAMRLTSDLQRSREQLVLTREEERRRLRRDLHDGLGPNLASQGLKLAAVKQLLQSNPAAAPAIPLLDQVMEQNTSTVADIRRLVYGLRPPALDELGLVAAVRDHVAGMEGKSTLQIEITDPSHGLPPLQAGVEVAAYRIILEALTNVIRHAQARYCTIRFSVCPNGSSDDLQIEIQDDGRGLPEDRRAGVGLRSMRERAEELGGTCSIENNVIDGTRVLVRLPIGQSGGSRMSPDR